MTFPQEADRVVHAVYFMQCAQLCSPLSAICSFSVPSLSCAHNSVAMRTGASPVPWEAGSWEAKMGMYVNSGPCWRRTTTHPTCEPPRIFGPLGCCLRSPRAYGCFVDESLSTYRLAHVLERDEPHESAGRSRFDSASRKARLREGIQPRVCVGMYEADAGQPLEVVREL